MSWKDLLSDKVELVLPWTGGRAVFCRDRQWTIEGKLPREFGWYRFETGGGRGAILLEPADSDPGFEEGHPRVSGFIVGNRLIPDNAKVIPDPNRLIDQTLELFLVERGLDRFSRGVAVRVTNGNHIYMHQEFPLGPEQAVLEAYQDRKTSVDDIPGVIPALDLGFRFITRERERAEERVRELDRLRIEEEKKRVAAERLQEAMKSIGTGAGRRNLAIHDFDAAAKAALAISGAVFLDSRDDPRRGLKVVKYRFQNQRLECIVDKLTLRVVDAGICLTDHNGTKGDTLFTLESLPTAVDEAIQGHKLHVYLGDDGYEDAWND